VVNSLLAHFESEGVHPPSNSVANVLKVLLVHPPPLLSDDEIRWLSSTKHFWSFDFIGERKLTDVGYHQHTWGSRECASSAEILGDLAHHEVIKELHFQTDLASPNLCIS
ncbi:hypothetical protein VNI00_019305, partial [Paramarasmius palmivorus]